MNAYRWLRCLTLFLFAMPALVSAEPYLAVRYGMQCSACHVNPSGGGLRNAVGHAFAKGSVAAQALPPGWSDWSGSVLDQRLRLGGDLRSAATRTEVSGQPSQSTRGTEQARLYADVQLIKDRLGVYLDQQLSPGKSVRQEAYVRLSTSDMAWYAKAGQFYLPFGWRLQDSLTFVRQLSGVSMTVPDKGLEVGMERGAWTAQMAYTNGPGKRRSDAGHQLTGQLSWLQPWGRAGLSMAQVRAPGGNRDAWGLFAGTTTGPVAWLTEIDLVADSGFPEGKRRQFAGLLEANWLMAQGHNLKLGSEFLDPDRRIGNDHRVRYSLVYEYTPIAFAQLRLGYRKFGGIPQNAVDNRRQAFAELHAFF
ncbi:MAG: hypothetical protein CFE41_17105 [Burkholderiales bacterium PBB2]|nr:MAG: hypothetical protein CFE41_17105 [Burkholderiales bacterium PBB2]